MEVKSNEKNWIIWNDNGLGKDHKGYYEEEMTEKELKKYLKQLKQKGVTIYSIEEF